MNVYAALGYVSTTRFRDDEVPPSTRIARALTLRVKAGDEQASAAAARWLFAAFPALAVELAGAVFVPLPSSKVAAPTESFARALARHVARATVAALVQRTRAVPSSRLLRRSGHPGVSIAVHIDSMRLVAEPDASHVVFVDDVFTTGATANAAAHHLRRGVTLIVAAQLHRRPRSIVPARSPAAFHLSNQPSPTTGVRRRGRTAANAVSRSTMSSEQATPRPSVIYVTREQVERIKRLNARTKDGGLLIGTRSDIVELVERDDARADMLTGQWLGLVIGVLPDGSAHS